jgi:hypothetical protein
MGLYLQVIEVFPKTEVLEKPRRKKMTTLLIMSMPLTAGIIFVIYLLISNAKEKKAKTA